MLSGRGFLLGLLLFAGFSASSQKIVYSEPERDDTKRLDFEIIGKINGNFLIYKNIRNKNWISILNNDMIQVAKVEQDYVPEHDNLLNIDFFPYSDFFYMIYQYRKRNIIHCVAAKVDGNGKKIGDLVELDTTHLNFGAESKIYSVISSEDKSKLIVFKINSKNKRLYFISTLLLDDKLTELKRSRLSMEMNDRDDYLGEFQLDNDGDLIFSKFDRVNNENIGTAAFVVKYAQADSFMVRTIGLEKTYLDEVRIKPDNVNKRYFITSFFYKQRRGNVEGYYFFIWDKNKGEVMIEDTVSFSEELRREARGNAGTKSAFNDYFIRNIYTKRDGGFIIASEAYYTTSNSSGWNRYNYLYGAPYMRSYDYYYYSPYYSSYWWNRWDYNGQTRYQADNIAVLSFTNTGQREWSVVIAKDQYDDGSDNKISYQVMNTGGKLHFLFNQREKGTDILNDFGMDPSGKVQRNPTLKNLGRDYEFMPKFGKQVSSRQIIIPCAKGNYICFAKLEYS